MKFYSLKNEVITIPADLEAAKRCHYLFIKSEQKAEKKPPEVTHMDAEVNIADLDARYDPNSS